MMITFHCSLNLITLTNRSSQQQRRPLTKKKKAKHACARELLRRDVSHCRKHRDAPVLEFGLAAALEVLHAAVSSKPQQSRFQKCSFTATSNSQIRAMMSKKPSGVPESDRILHTKFILKRTKRRSGVVGPVTPSAACEAVLDTVLIKCKQKRVPKTHYHLPGTDLSSSWCTASQIQLIKHTKLSCGTGPGKTSR